MASIENIKGSDGSGNANVATIQSTRAPLASTINVDTVLGINPGGFAGSMGTPHTFVDPITSETITVISEATAVDFIGHVDSGNLEIDTIAPGYTDAGSAVGDIVIIKPTTQYADNLAEVLEVALEDDGKLKPNALVNSPQVSLDNITPVGAVLDYAGASAPAGWLLCFGQSLLRAGTYADLFAAIGVIHGSVDGTHFNVPDLRGRVVAGQDDMGGTSANRLTTPLDGDTLGAAGGAENVNLAHTHGFGGTTEGMSSLGSGVAMTAGGVDINHVHIFSGTTGSTGSATQTIVQPTIVLNKIIKY